MKSSCGSATSSSWRTVRPPTPLSNTAIGSRRDGMAPWCQTPRRGPSPDGVQRTLEVLGDRLADALRAVHLLRGEDDGREQPGDEQDQADVLDRDLATLLAGEPVDGGVDAPHELVSHVETSLGRRSGAPSLTPGMLRSAGTRIQTAKRRNCSIFVSGGPVRSGRPSSVACRC